MSEEFSGTFTMDDLQGTSQRLNFTGFTNDTAGHGTDHSFSIQIQEPSPTTSSVITSTTTTDEPSEFPAIPVFGFVIVGSFIVICYISMIVGGRIRNR